MRRSITTTAILFALCVYAVGAGGVFAQPPAPAGTNTITVVLPGLKQLYEDLKVPFELVGDLKGHEVLVDVLDVFVVGVERDKPIGARIMSSSDGLRGTMTMPVSLPAKGVIGDAKSDPQYKKLRENLWDLDLKTSPPPNPIQIKLVPTATRTKAAGMGMTAGERLMFGGRDGVMGRDAQAVHIAKELSDLRSLKGPIPFNYPEGVDLAVTIDGTVQKPEARAKAFKKVRDELLSVSKKRAEEADTAFALRDTAFKHLVDELERFYTQSAKIQLLWTLDNEKKQGRSVLELTALPETELEQSAHLVKAQPSKYASVETKNTSLTLTANLPLDPLRKAHALELYKVVKDYVEYLIDTDDKKEAVQKTADKMALGIFFEALKEVSDLAELTGCVRSWPTQNGQFDSLGVLKIAGPKKYMDVLQGLKEIDGPIKVDLAVDTIGEVVIHKIVSEAARKQFPELVSADGSIYIGLSQDELWYASGDTVLQRLKDAIQATAQPAVNPVPPLSVTVRMGPLTQFIDSYTKRNPLPKRANAVGAGNAAAGGGGQAAKKGGGAKRPGLANGSRDANKSPLETVITLLGDLDIQSVASRSFTKEDDVVELKMDSVEGKVVVESTLDTGLLRFLGNGMSKFVKDNLADD